MTVADLIGALSKLPDDSTVRVWINDSNHGYEDFEVTNAVTDGRCYVELEYSST